MSDNQSRISKFFTSRTNVALLVFMLAGGYFLITEHAAHVLSAAPYLLLLACIGMHFFMHGGHGHNHDNQEQHPLNHDEDRKS